SGPRPVGRSGRRRTRPAQLADQRPGRPDRDDPAPAGAAEQPVLRLRPVDAAVDPAAAAVHAAGPTTPGGAAGRAGCRGGVRRPGAPVPRVPYRRRPDADRTARRAGAGLARRAAALPGPAAGPP